MKTKFFLLTLLCLFLLSVTGHAQPGMPTPEEQQAAAQQAKKDSIKSSMRLNWNSRTSNLLTMSVLNDPDVRVAFGVSDEQYEQILDAQHPLKEPVMSRMQSSPEVQKVEETMKAIVDKAPNPPPTTGGYVPQMLGLDGESLKKLLDLQKVRNSLMRVASAEACLGILTPEQERKINESLLVSMEALEIGRPLVSPRMFEALDLTDAQKQQMKILEQEFEPELEKHLENIANARIKLGDKISATLQKQEGETLREKAESANKDLAIDPELKEILDDIQSRQKAFATQFMAEMGKRKILTNEQWARLQTLFDDPPEYAKVFGRVLRGEHLTKTNGSSESGESSSSSGQKGNDKREESRSGGWQPGPGSWRPGDAIPEQYRQERNSRFPRGTE